MRKGPTALFSPYRRQSGPPFGTSAPIGVLPLPVLANGAGDFGKPRAVLGQFQDIRRGEKLDAIRRRIAQRLQ